MDPQLCGQVYLTKRGRISNKEKTIFSTNNIEKIGQKNELDDFPTPYLITFKFRCLKTDILVLHILLFLLTNHF